MSVNTYNQTTGELNKIAGKPNIVLEDNLESSSTINALSANQGRVLDEKIHRIYKEGYASRNYLTSTVFYQDYLSKAVNQTASLFMNEYYQIVVKSGDAYWATTEGYTICLATLPKGEYIFFDNGFNDTYASDNLCLDYYINGTKYTYTGKKVKITIHEDSTTFQIRFRRTVSTTNFTVSKSGTYSLVLVLDDGSYENTETIYIAPTISNVDAYSKTINSVRLPYSTSSTYNMGAIVSSGGTYISLKPNNKDLLRPSSSWTQISLSDYFSFKEDKSITKYGTDTVIFRKIGYMVYVYMKFTPSSNINANSLLFNIPSGYYNTNMPEQFLGFAMKISNGQVNGGIFINGSSVYTSSAITTTDGIYFTGWYFNV